MDVFVVVVGVDTAPAISCGIHSACHAKALQGQAVLYASPCSGVDGIHSFLLPSILQHSDAFQRNGFTPVVLSCAANPETSDVDDHEPICRQYVQLAPTRPVFLFSKYDRGTVFVS